ncbi:MAG TPA: TIGR01777 family oxidoreductase [Thermoleophilia bacterium]|nr:TIGR01777 family oxidoreductase [Thermoleophilia bacterium]
MPIFEWRSVMPASADEVFAYHARPGAFRRLAPPWQKLVVREESGDVTGGRVAFDVWFGPVKRHWVAETGSAMPGRQFVDRQVEGPFAAWEHVHRFVPVEAERSELIDHVEYRLPAGGFTDAFGEGPAGKTLTRVFHFRHERTRLDLGRHAVWAERPRLKVVVAGASGLVGSSLTDYLTTAGHTVVRLVRGKDAGPGEIPWDPATGALYHGALEGADAVVNLSGVSLAGVWTPGRRRAILDSRVQATRTLAEAIARMEQPPAVFLSTSAVGAYGSRGDEAITEQTGRGSGYLADVCRAWEEAADPARDAGVRVVHPRFGIIVSASGGAFAPLIATSRAGLGARFGSGDQYWAWVELDDVLAALEWMLHDEELEGPVNVTAPEPLTNREVTKALGKVLRRPAVLAAPGVIVRRGTLGMGDEMLLASQRAVPARLQERGFRFAFPKLEGALRYELGKD